MKRAPIPPLVAGLGSARRSAHCARLAPKAAARNSYPQMAVAACLHASMQLVLRQQSFSPVRACKARGAEERPLTRRTERVSRAGPPNREMTL